MTPNLFDQPPAQLHSATSLVAARAIAASISTLRERVYIFLRDQGPHTDTEMQTAMAMNPSTQRPRRIELVEQGRVRDSGTTRKTPSGRDAVVWMAVEDER